MQTTDWEGKHYNLNRQYFLFYLVFSFIIIFSFAFLEAVKYK